MEKPTLVILAAGMGSRYGGLKQIDPVDDKGHRSLISRSMMQSERDSARSFSSLKESMSRISESASAMQSANIFL